MNFGKTLSELRREQNITQEHLAAMLGVTAAAVSKWENGYSLPDILMLCALADFFGVTTDRLLGRNQQKRYAAVCASSEALGERIAALARQHGLTVKAVCGSREEASNIIRDDEEITYLICGILGNTFPELGFDLGGRTISLYMSISDSPEGILQDLRKALGSNL